MSAVERVARALCVLDGHNPDDVGGESFDDGLVHWVAYEPQARAAMAAMSVWIYEAGRENMKVFATEEAAQRWFAENDPEGVAFEYPIEV